MKLRDFIEMLTKPLAITLLILIAGTFLSYLIGIPTGDWSWRLNKLNLAREENFATWFESLTFLICALSFAMVGWSRNVPAESRWIQRLFQVIALISCFFAADEIMEIHEKIGVKLERVSGIFRDTAISEVGFSWILVYAPILLVGGVVFLYVLKRYNATRSTLRIVPKAKVYLIVAICCVPMVLLFEATEGYLWSLGNYVTLVPCFEESFEVIALFSFIRFNTIIAMSYDL